MAKQFPVFEAEHLRLIEEQHMFFVATAAPTGRVNLSPKGMDSLRVLDANRLIWLNVTGSGNESAGHVRQDPRMTVMWCSFVTRPVILRAYGQARMVQPRDADWVALAAQLPALPGARQIFDLRVDLVQTSCGYAVPFYDFAGERETLKDWTTRQGPDALAAYQRSRNAETLDGFATGILEDD